MPLNDQQRNIINPFAEEETNYSYDDLRNRFVLDAIHESYTNYFTLLPINKVLEISVEQMSQLGIERTVENLTVTRDDLLAYEVLYPQNCSSSALKGRVVHHQHLGSKLRQRFRVRPPTWRH